MSEITFNQFRQNVKAHYKRIIRDTIEPQVLRLFHKYEDLVITQYNNDSLKYELSQLLNYYIDSRGMDSYIVYEVYDEIANEYNSKHCVQSESSFVDDSIKNCIDKFGYLL